MRLQESQRLQTLMQFYLRQVVDQNTDDLGCENAGVKLTDRGGVVTDEHLKTSADNIWAAGDVCGKLQFTYISLDDSRLSGMK